MPGLPRSGRAAAERFLTDRNIRRKKIGKTGLRAALKPLWYAEQDGRIRFQYLCINFFGGYFGPDRAQLEGVQVTAGPNAPH